MSVMTTAPERIALMLRDSDPRVASSHFDFQKSIDTIDRPAWLVSDQSGEYTMQSSGQAVNWFTESYMCEFFGELYNTGREGEYEAIMKDMVRNAIIYFARRPRLQFTNDRAIAGLTELPTLRYVKHITIRRDAASLMTTGGGEERAFWGSKIYITVNGGIEADEALVAI